MKWLSNSLSKADHTFGCDRCWPSGADAAWLARDALSRDLELIDESHFHVMILACPSCLQRFVSIFTETVDWQDGEDPQYWTLFPITSEEASELARQRGALSAGTLNTLDGERRSLQHDHPKGSAARSYWRTGVTVGFHD